MWIEVRKGKRGTTYRCHIKKINERTGLEVKKAKMFDLRSEAEAWGRGIEADLERGKFLDTRAIDSQELANYIQKYIEHITPLEGQVPDKVGWDREVTRLKVWLNNPLASRPISKVSHVDMLDYIKNRRRSHSKRVKPDAEPRFISEQTIKHELVVLSNVYEFARVYYQLEGLVNPVHAIPKGLKPGGSREVDVRIPPDKWKELEPLLAARRNLMYVLATELAIETAMRQGELLRIEPKDILPTPQECEYVTATDFRQKGGKVVAYTRNIPLTSRAKQIIKKVLTLRAKMKNVPSPTIWGTISADGLSRAFSEDCATLGIVDSTGQTASFHSTRHEACSRMANHEIPINKLQKITGHRTMSQLQRYYNPTVTDLIDSIKVMNRKKRS